MERKANVARAFGRAVDTYKFYGSLQQQVAKTLCQKFSPFPQGQWLEVGCGTGFLTEELLAHHPEKLFANDISLQMGMSLPSDERLEFILGDGEALAFPSVSMIASSFALQWFSDPISTLHKWAKICQKVVVALPIAPSFLEWEIFAKEHGIEMTLNHLPNDLDLQKLGGQLVIEEIPLDFASPWAFLVWFKKLGANISLGNKRMPISFLKQLSKEDKPFHTKIRVAYLEVLHV